MSMYKETDANQKERGRVYLGVYHRRRRNASSSCSCCTYRFFTKGYYDNNRVAYTSLVLIRLYIVCMKFIFMRKDYSLCYCIITVCLWNPFLTFTNGWLQIEVASELETDCFLYDRQFLHRQHYIYHFLVSMYLLRASDISCAILPRIR